MTSPATQATASQHSASQIMAHYANGLRAFTFWVSDTLYAIDISKVLTISRELGNMLTEREKDHIEWVQALEDSLLNDTPFVKAKDPHKCAFGQWYDTFKSRGETLMEALSEFDKPHTQIHSLADKLLDMKKNNDLDHALKILRYERNVTLKCLMKRFEQARTYLKESSRQVLLYITRDGIAPTVALRIDDINDVIDFTAEQFKPMEHINSILNSEASELVIAYLKQSSQADCLLVEASNLLKIARS